MPTLVISKFYHVLIKNKSVMPWTFFLQFRFTGYFFCWSRASQFELSNSTWPILKSSEIYTGKSEEILIKSLDRYVLDNIVSIMLLCYCFTSTVNI